MADNENAPETDVLDSEPNADSEEGLAGGMGVSSERVGTMRGSEPGTNGAERTQAPPPMADPPPEQSSDPASGEPRPDPPVLKDHGPRSGA